MSKILVILMVLASTTAQAGHFGIEFNVGAGACRVFNPASGKAMAGLQTGLKFSYSFKRFQVGTNAYIGPTLKEEGGYAGAGIFVNRRTKVRSNTYTYYGIDADIVGADRSTGYSGGLHYGLVKILSQHWDFVLETGINLGSVDYVTKKLVQGTGYPPSHYYEYERSPNRYGYLYIPLTIGFRCIF